MENNYKNIYAQYYNNPMAEPNPYPMLQLGDYYKVDFISMGQSYTDVYLAITPNRTYNSIYFKFYEREEENGNLYQIDIFSDIRFNPYLY